MAILEAYCDGCDMPAPIHESIIGMGAGQAVRELFPAYHRRLYLEHGWRTINGNNLCADCGVLYDADPSQLKLEVAYARKREYVRGKAVD